MTMSIAPMEPGHPEFAGLVSDVDLRNPLRAEDVARVESGLDRFGVLVFRGQDLTDQQQIAFTQQF
jgi:alpha-ketoglutarate-dependent 2,4-dichlorophenoxyacetate dioxygenase